MKRLFWIFICVGFSFKNDHSAPYLKMGNAIIENTPSLSLSAPLRNELSVTGSFGELRNNHFHAGIDLRSGYGLLGDDILSAADGYVSKIIIDSDNYGKSLYISHPNGMITVYGHLNGFRKDLGEYVKVQQYAKKSFKIELNFKPTDFPVHAGDLVAYMGNTGASHGKHLHFELRNASNDEVLDPVAFGLPLKDDIKPTIRRVKVYGYDGEGEEVSSKVFTKSMVEKMHGAINIPGNVFSVGLDALDRCDYSRNYIGIKYIKLLIDGGLLYEFSADKWRIDETKYVNAHVDYFAKTRKGQFHRCFVLSGNKMNMYHSLQNDGFFYMKDELEHAVKLIAGDANGNESEINFKIKKSSFSSKLRASKYGDIIYHDLEKSFNTEDAELKYPAGSVYEDLNCELREYSNSSSLAYSNWVCLFPSNDPVHLPAEIKLKAEKTIPENLHNKCFIAVKRGKSVQSVGGEWEGDYLVSKARSLGPFCIMADNTAPTIKPLRTKRKKYAGDQISFRISDNIPTAKELPDIYYETNIDGKWALMEYDKKSGIIRHKFEDWLSKGKHNYELLVRDQMGNERTYKGSFVR